MRIEIIYEGQTEKHFCLKLARILDVTDTGFTSSEGKDKLNQLIRSDISRRSSQSDRARASQ